MKELLDSVGSTLSRRATVESVFGAPIVVGARTFVPVARIQFGFGGGNNDGSPGAGGGLEATPLGLLELTEEGARFLPLASATTLIAEVTEGIRPLAPGSWLLSHDGHFALVHAPQAGAWLQQVAGPIDLVVGSSFLAPPPGSPQPGDDIWQGELGGEPIFVLGGAQLVVFRGTLLVPQGCSDDDRDQALALLPPDYVVHTNLH